MTLTGACPGTVLVQLSTGIRSGYFVFVGAVLGGTVYAVFGDVVRRTASLSSSTSAKSTGSSRDSRSDLSVVEPKTVHGSIGTEQGKLVLFYEAFLVFVLALASSLERADGMLVPPVVGGMCIGVGQVATLVLTGNAVGVSGAYGQVGEVLKRSLFGNGKDGVSQKPAYNSVAFTTGIVAGSSVLSRVVGFSIPGGEAPIPDLTAVYGGFVMVLGARIAGGCTSGHGITGMATFSVASIVSVVAMFAGGMGLAQFV